jgi:hypothetical protein
VKTKVSLAFAVDSGLDNTNQTKANIKKLKLFLIRLILGKLLIIESTLKIVSAKMMLHHSKIKAIDSETRVK